jgi:hypothetical protein
MFLKIQMYSVKEFSKDLRENFKLSYNPYHTKNETERQEVLDYLKNLGVIFYRDDRNGLGILIQPDQETKVRKMQNFGAWKYGCALEDSGVVAEWPEKSEPHIEAYGDNYIWMHWAKAVHVISIDERRVQVA